MAPTFHDGQLVLVFKHQYMYQYDDVIVFNEDGTTMVKRIIGLPGDEISLTNGLVIRNGIILEQFQSSKEQILTILLDKNELFVIGDNFTDSIDSRSFGPIEQSHVIGKVILNLRIALPGLRATLCYDEEDVFNADLT